MAAAAPEVTVTKGKRSDPGPALSPRAEAAIMRLAELLGRQIARELHEERNRQREQKDNSPEQP
ncbi:hypothetical protein CA833_19900 [Novosphingobium sp. KA1]|nr:hypothetical protein CA833_19900 [Novosphingobium sp. KA1]